MEDRDDRIPLFTAVMSVLAMILIGFVVHSIMWRSVSPAMHAPYLSPSSDSGGETGPRADPEKAPKKARPARSGVTAIA